ncbi:hypothetical protein FB562_0456 [Homoserinimonas aerilata]|uniref:Uncharacterized protein n=1 Tax=Homoserinimonas aerilata TaxID=1162970 RepID=A0A542YH55_9MICO|nr:hypothetical protein [Homoserinimonas aerilata]TQL47398.1 hypothetical protein FB562_0456 [Homoserinimonas aerilata]
MDSLDGRSTGLYLVVTESASYRIDFTRMLLNRTPDALDDAIRRMRNDTSPVQLVRVLRCHVGEPMILDINLGIPGVLLTRRSSTTVTSIEPLTPTHLNLGKDLP